MFPIIKKTLVPLIIFLLVPLVVLLLNWHWEPEFLSGFSECLFWITESAGAPWAIITSFILFLVFCYCIQVKTKSAVIKLLLILIAAVLCGQLVKSLVKNYAEEPRPFVLWIEEQYQIDDEYFYSLPREERKNLIIQQLNWSTEIPSWLNTHWQAETGYSFPSGHTLFAVTWAFLAMVLFGLRRRHVILSSMIIGWAILIQISRLALGMHHPIDLILGTILAWLISLACYFCAKKWHIVE